MKNIGPKRRSHETEGDFAIRCVSDSSLREVFTYTERIEYAKANMNKVEQEDNYNEVDNYRFETRDEAAESAKRLGLETIRTYETETGATFWMPGKDMDELRKAIYFNSQNKERFCEGCENCEQDIEILTKEKAMSLNTQESVDLGFQEEFAIFLSGSSFLIATKTTVDDYSDETNIVKVPLNKPFKNTDNFNGKYGGPKSMSVCVKSDDSILMVNFSEPKEDITEEKVMDFNKNHNTKELNKQQAAFWYSKMITMIR